MMTYDITLLGSQPQPPQPCFADCHSSPIANQAFHVLPWAYLFYDYGSVVWFGTSQVEPFDRGLLQNLKVSYHWPSHWQFPSIVLPIVRESLVWDSIVALVSRLSRSNMPYLECQTSRHFGSNVDGFVFSVAYPLQKASVLFIIVIAEAEPFAMFASQAGREISHTGARQWFLGHRMCICFLL